MAKKKTYRKSTRLVTCPVPGCGKVQRAIGLRAHYFNVHPDVPYVPVVPPNKDEVWKAQQEASLLEVAPTAGDEQIPSKSTEPDLGKGDPDARNGTGASHAPVGASTPPLPPRAPAANGKGSPPMRARTVIPSRSVSPGGLAIVTPRSFVLQTDLLWAAMRVTQQDWGWPVMDPSTWMDTFLYLAMSDYGYTLAGYTRNREDVELFANRPEAPPEPEPEPEEGFTLLEDDDSEEPVMDAEEFAYANP